MSTADRHECKIFKHSTIVRARCGLPRQRTILRRCARKILHREIVVHFPRVLFEESAAVSICNHDAYGRYNGSPTITDIQERTSIDEYALSAKVKPLSKRSLKIFRCAVSRR